MQPGQRKLAAIVAADVAGYSRLVAADDEGTIARWHALRHEVIDPAIESHRGRIANTAGDSILLEFASAVEAVRWSLVVQREIAERNAADSPDRQIRLRIGVTVGDVIAVGDDLLGDGVNVAARLEALADPGGLCLSAVVHGYVQGKVEAVFTDGGAHAVKNIPQPVHVWRWSPDGTAEPSAVRLSRSAKPMIAVLPFANLSNDPEQAYFADGITEDVALALSRFREFAVIAHSSSVAFKQSTVSRDAFAHELGARFVVEGSVRRSGDRVRVTARLIDTKNASQLWADRYDGDLSDVFALQDEVSAAIASAIAPRSYEAETRRAERLTEDEVGAWDLLLRARALLAPYTGAGHVPAIALLRKAVQLDPRNVQAHAWLSAVLVTSIHLGWIDDIPAARDEAGLSARVAIDLDPEDALARIALGIYHGYERHDWRRGIEELRHALHLNPSLANAHGALSSMLAITGDLAGAREHLAIATRLSPRDPRRSGWLSTYQAGPFTARLYEDTVAWATRCIEEYPENLGFYRV